MRRSVLPVRAALLFLWGLVFFLGGALAEAATAEEATGRKWAFCIGIGDYRDPEILDIPGARNDAKGLARALEEHGGFEEVLVLTDDLEARSPLFPSRGHIQALLHKAVPKIRKDDLVLFSFSGHGFTDGSGSGYLITADSRLRSPAATGLPLNAILDFLKKTGVRNSILMLDAAREKIYKRGGLSPEGIYPDRYLRKGVSALLYAAKKGYHSQDDGDSEYGVFTGALIRGLEGAADREYGGNRDGVVSLAEMTSYVDLALTDWSLKGPLRQVPYTEILESDDAFGTISSVRKIRVAKALPTAVPPWLGVWPPERKEPEKKSVAAREAPKKREEARPKEPARPPAVLASAQATEPRPAAVVGPPAPSVKDLAKEVKQEAPKKKAEPVAVTLPASKEPSAKEATKTAPPQEPAKAAGVQAPKEPVKPQAAAESTPAKEPRPTGVVGPPAPSTKDLVKDEDAATRDKSAAQISQSQKPGPQPIPAAVQASPPRETPPTTGEATKDAKPPERVAAVPPPPMQDALRLRNRGKELSPQDVKVMLTLRRFYATCWNYNGDFCNPDGDFENAFRDNQDGTVTDGATGLMWQKGGSNEAVTWIGAREYLEKSNLDRLAGYSDWRIPTAEELASLMESSWKNSDLFIDPVFDRTQRQCWSVDTRGVESAWKANFHMGFLMDFPMTAKHSVRLVRSVQ